MLEFADFDASCNRKLKQLSVVLKNKGQLKMKDALTIWFQNALKPTDTKLQNWELAGVTYRQALLNKSFHHLAHLAKDKRALTLTQCRAINMINHIINKSNTQELKRSLAIWKSTRTFWSGAELNLRRVVLKCYKRRLANAVREWQRWSNELGTQARLTLLKRQYVQSLMQTSVSEGLRFTVKYGKHLDRVRLGHVIKAWRELVQRNKYLLSQFTSSMKYARARETYAKRVVFNELRIHKEVQKQQILSLALQTDIESAIAIQTKAITTKQKVENHANRKFCGRVIEQMLSKYTMSYFQHWAQVTAERKLHVQTRMKD